MSGLQRCGILSNRKIATVLKDKIYWIILGVIAIIPFLMIFNDNLWFDELFSYNIIHNSYAGIWKETAYDVHPPLYYWGLKFFTSIILGDHVWEYKLFSYLGYIATIALGILIRKYTENTKIAWLYMFLFACMPAAIRRAVEVRMYSWAVFWVTLAFVEIYAIIDKNEIKDWVVLTCVSICGIYTHYYALFSLFIFFIVLFGWFTYKKKRNWILRYMLSGILISVSYIPWLDIIIKQFVKINTDEDSFAIAKFSLRSLAECGVYFFHTGINILTICYSAIFIIVFILAMICFYRESRNDLIKDWSVMGIVMIVLLVLFLIIISINYENLMGPKYFTVVLGVVLLIFAIYIDNLPLKRRPIICIAGCALICMCATYIDVTQDQYDDSLKKLNMRLRPYLTDSTVVFENWTMLESFHILNPELDYCKVLEEKWDNRESPEQLIFVGSEKRSVPKDYFLVDEFEGYSRYQSINYYVVVVQKEG